LPGESGRFPQISGMKVVYDSSADPGSRVISVTIDGSPLDPNGSYTLASIGYVLDGGDGYTMLADMPYVTMFGTMIDCLTGYIRDTGVVTYIPAGRLTDLSGSS
ncbi:MAG: 5'-nucleotidase, partial [Candidatus Methanomethylophilaceae archaeon]|nr:5'-nucleotidase [Candidatus Methanomethylophilaceae archaeon]